MSDQTIENTQIIQDPLVFKRLTITTGDSTVYIDDKSYSEIDLSWIPTYNDVKVHAVQWYDGSGEIELKSSDPNIPITELGIFERAIDQWKEKHQILLDEKSRIEEERKSLEEDMILNAQNFTIDDLDIEELLAQL